jgi:hypothetical protein
MPSNSTIKIYQNIINKIDKIDDMSSDDVLNYINDLRKNNGELLSISSQKMMLCAIIWYFGDKINCDKLRARIFEISKDTTKQDLDHTRTSSIIPIWDEVIKLRNTLFDKDHLILSLFTYMPPRRLKDYVCMVIGTGDYDNLNYYDHINAMFIFNNYKTKKTYHTQKFAVNPILDKIIKSYINDHKLTDGDLLLGYTSTRALDQVFHRLLSCGVNGMRHSYINFLYPNLPDSQKIEAGAYQMGHSLTEHFRYRKRA